MKATPSQDRQIERISAEHPRAEHVQHNVSQVDGYCVVEVFLPSGDVRRISIGRRGGIISDVRL